MRIIKINVETQKVEELNIPKWKGLADLYRLIGNECTTIEASVIYPNGDALYCDEEARLFEDHAAGGFTYPDWKFPVINNALIVGTTDEGRDTDAKSTIEEIQKDIVWLDAEAAKKELL